MEHITSHFTAAVSTVYSSEKSLSKCLFSKLFEVAEKQSDLTGKTPTFATSEIDKDTGLFTITKVLQPNTTYYIRAMVFFNDKWVAAPEVVSVKTADFDPNIKPPEIAK